MCNIDNQQLNRRRDNALHDESNVNMIADTKTEEKKKGEKWNRKPSVVEDKEFSSKVSKYFIVYFDEVSKPTKKIHSFIPLITLVRSVMISISVFVFISIPFLQVSLVLSIEISYMMIVLIYNNKNEIGAKILDMTSSVINSIYVALKFVTLFGIDDHTRQEIIGMCMVVLLVANLGAYISYVVYSLGIMFIDIVKSMCGEKDEKKERDDSSVWCRKYMYEFTRPVSLAPAEPEELLIPQPIPTPIVLDPPVVNKGIIPKKNPVRGGMRRNPRPNRVMNQPVLKSRVRDSPEEANKK